MSIRPTRPIVCAALVAALLPSAVDGQFRRGRAQEDVAAWAPFVAGIKAGYDQNANGEVLGAMMRLPVLRSGILELMPSADVTFLNGAKEYQYGVDLVWVSGGGAGGPFAGVGLGYRHSVIATTPGDPTQRLLAYSLAAGVRTGFGGPFQLQLELRWIFPEDVTFRPTPITLGIGFPLTGRRPSG